MTRVDRTTPDPLNLRVIRAVKAGCTHFLSLHCNAADNPQAHGTEVWYHKPEDEQLALKLSQSVGYALGLSVRGARRSDTLAVLKFALGPALLLELGFLSHIGDRAALLDEGKRKRACQAMVDVLTTPQ